LDVVQCNSSFKYSPLRPRRVVGDETGDARNHLKLSGRSVVLALKIL